MVDAGNRSRTWVAGDPLFGGGAVENVFPLTARQTLLWVERKMHPGVPLHNVLLTVELTGILDVDRLERAYHAAVDELDFLRLVVDEREPRQWLTTVGLSPLEVVDLSANPQGFDAWLAERSKHVFTVLGPLHWSFLVRRSPTRHVFCVLFDNICTDEVSAMLFANYLGELYDGLIPQRPSSFREYACDDARYRASADGERDAEFWRGELRRGGPRLRLYGQSQTCSTPVVRRVRRDFGDGRGAALQRLVSSSEFATGDAARSWLALMVTLLVAFVSRTSEQTDVTVAIPLSNRPGPWRGAFGLLHEKGFVRVELAEGETFRSLFEKVHHKLLDTVRHGPCCVPDRDIEHVALNLIDTRQPSFSTLGCRADVAPIWTLPQMTFDGEGRDFSNATGVRLTVSAPSCATLAIGFDTSAELLSDSQHHRMVGHFERLVDAVLDDPRGRIADVDLTLDAERTFALTAARGPEPPPAPDLIARIAEQCRRHPDKLAVIASDGRLTYGDLATRVVALAARLRELGVVPESVVAVSMPRGARELTALLAILTAGGAYVPLDPAQPLSRLCMIMEDARPQLLITSRNQLLAAHAGSVPILFVDDEKPGFNRSADASWTASTHPDALAYVLFTSGSTGRPKGVQITRGALANLVASMVRTPGITESDVLLAVSTTMFDIAALELFGPLHTGATVRIADADTVADARRLRTVLDCESISIMQATPTMWRMLLDAGWSSDRRLRMLVGGEPLSPELARQLLQRGELWNMYGPTETTVWSAIKHVAHADDISVGKPIERTQIYVLDGHGRLAPVGVTGELCIGGAGVARGYLGRQDLTQEKFVQNPYGPAGDRIYRTGDLARLMETGEFECRGRLDHQIKIRGFRVELGEIEARLEELASVRHAVVTLDESHGREPRLVAYLVPAADAELSAHELTQRLRRRLPAYMVPAKYISMESPPLNTNGKIDRQALPDPDGFPDLPAERGRRAPCTPTEATLLRIWTRTLGTTDIGLDDEFLELGGQSVLAVRMFDEIHRSLMVDLPLASLFETPTIASLAKHIDDLRGSSSQHWTTVVPIQPRGSLPPIFCVSGIGGNPITFVAIAAALGDQQPFYGLQHRGVDGRLRPHTSIRGMAEEFVDDIRAVQPRGPYVLAGYSAGGLAAYDMAQLLTDSGEQVDMLILFDTVNPLLANWSQAERVGAHWANLCAGGPRYVAERAADRISRMVAVTTMWTRAKLATRWPYRFRLDALHRAVIQAESAYVPRSYTGDVLLIQSAERFSPRRGIGQRSDESNGWRQYVEGRLEIFTVPAGHLHMMDGAAAQLAAAEVRRTLQTTARG